MGQLFLPGDGHARLSQGDSPRLPLAPPVVGEEVQRAGVEMVTLFGPLPARDAGSAAAPATASLAFACARMMRLVREPDAAIPHVRFDEREVETASWDDTRAPATDRAGNMQGVPRRPRHLSTLLATHGSLGHESTLCAKRGRCIRGCEPLA